MTANEYYQKMCERYAELAGYSPDAASDTGIRLGILAGELAGLEERAAKIEADASPLTATGRSLEVFAEQRGLGRRMAARARGTLRFTRSAAEEIAAGIPAGTVCYAQDDTAFETLEQASIPAGATEALVPAQAKEPGPGGNAQPKTILLMARPLPGVTGVENPTAFAGGDGQEEDASLRARLLASYAQPQNGANTAYYRELAERFPGIDSAAAIEGEAGGLSLAVAAVGQQTVPAETLAALAAEVERMRTPGLQVQTKNATATAVAVNVEVSPAAGVLPGRLSERLAQRIRRRLGQMRVGERLRRAELLRLLLEDAEVGNLRLTVPAEDVLPGPDGVVRAGAVTVQETEEQAWT